ncbi:MAG: rhodanese-like domain-containing protein [Ruminococcaceae bacterium]|nr:rhodanese-like domain-containing protein [Oscillospiraceae bacterium]
MKRFIFAPVFALCLLLCSCSQSEQTAGYVSISQEKAKQLMDSGDCIILDVRTPEEYNEGHIPGAVLIPDYDIKTKAEQILTDKNALILVYCRSGRRSKNAARELAALGYTNVREFGGIIDWPYDIEK